MPDVSVVLNPNARRSAYDVRERARRLRRILGRRGEVYPTATLTELSDAVVDILRTRPSILVTDGGDGTLHWVLNEARRHVNVGELPPLLPTNGGTIDFVAKKVGIRGHSETIVSELVRILDRGAFPDVVELDSLALSGKRAKGPETAFDRLGFALAAGGVGQRFFAKYYAEKELGAGAIVRVVTKAVLSRAAGQLRLPLPDRMLSYGRDVFSPTRAEVSIDGRKVPGQAHGAIHAGSIEVALGGVFRVFPLARDDGQLHFQAGEIVPQEMIRALPSLARGTAIPSDRLVETAGREMSIRALAGERLHPIVDGETYNDLSELTVRLGPRVRVPVVRAPARRK